MNDDIRPSRNSFNAGLNDEYPQFRGRSSAREPSTGRFTRKRPTISEAGYVRPEASARHDERAFTSFNQPFSRQQAVHAYPLGATPGTEPSMDYAHGVSFPLEITITDARTGNGHLVVAVAIDPHTGMVLGSRLKLLPEHPATDG